MIRLKAHPAPPPPPNPKLVQARLTGGRSVLLVAPLLTVLNTVLLLLAADLQFPFSVAAPYYLVAFAMGVNGGSAAGLYPLAALAFTGVVVTVYLLCWHFSKTRRGWLTAGIALFSVDTLLLAVLSVMLMGTKGANVVDLCVHIWMMFILATARKAEKQAVDLPED